MSDFLCKKYRYKKVYSPLYDKVFECTDIEEDGGYVYLYCQERFQENVYGEGIMFKEFEVRLL